MFGNFLHGLARALTIPAADRKKIDSNPEVQVAKAMAAPAITAGLNALIANEIKDPELAALAQLEAGHLLSSVGLTTPPVQQ